MDKTNIPMIIKIVTVFILVIGAFTFFQGLKEIISGLETIDVANSILKLTVGLLFVISAFAMRYMKKWGVILFTIGMIPILILFGIALLATKNLIILAYALLYLLVLLGALSQWHKYL